MENLTINELQVLRDALATERRRLSDTSYNVKIIKDQELKLEIAETLFFKVLSAIAKK
jgi:hypothetical protein